VNRLVYIVQQAHNGKWKILDGKTKGLLHTSNTRHAARLWCRRNTERVFKGDSYGVRK
jgi:hypothetical protein